MNLKNIISGIVLATACQSQPSQTPEKIQRTTVSTNGETQKPTSKTRVTSESFSMSTITCKENSGGTESTSLQISALPITKHDTYMAYVSCHASYKSFEAYMKTIMEYNQGEMVNASTLHCTLINDINRSIQDVIESCSRVRKPMLTPRLDLETADDSDEQKEQQIIRKMISEAVDTILKMNKLQMELNRHTRCQKI